MEGTVAGTSQQGQGFADSYSFGTMGQRGQHRTGLPKVPSLVFDIELESLDGLVGSAEEGEYAEGIRQIQRWVLPANAVEYRLISDVETAIRDEPAQATDVELLGQKLQRLGYRVAIRTALGGGDGQDCLKNLRHTFLTCTAPGVLEPCRKQYVVDPLFKEQFEIAKPSQRYATLLAALPDVFVGPEENIIPLVSFLSAELAASFKATGAVLPPWRQTASMLSKWRPRRSSEEKLDWMGQQHMQRQQQQLAQAPLAPMAMPMPMSLLQQQQPAWPSSIAAAAVTACKSPSTSVDNVRPLSLEPARVYFGGNFQAVPTAISS